MTYTCEPHKCISCSNQIHFKGETFQDKINRGIYKEITLELSNGSKMRVGLCNECFAKRDELDDGAMLEAIKERWRNTIKPTRKDSLETQIKDLKVNGASDRTIETVR